MGKNKSEGMRKKKEKKFKEEETRRIIMVLKREVNSKNEITSIRALAVPAISCTVGITNWSLEDIRRIEGNIKNNSDSLQNASRWLQI